MQVQPIKTLIAHGGMTFPVGLGIGATQLACAVISPARAAGILPIKVLNDPLAMIPGPAGTHPGNVQGPDMSDTRAAGLFPIRTVGQPLTSVSGNPGWGMGVGTGAGGCIGA